MYSDSTWLWYTLAFSCNIVLSATLPINTTLHCECHMLHHQLYLIQIKVTHVMRKKHTLIENKQFWISVCYKPIYIPKTFGNQNFGRWLHDSTNSPIISVSVDGDGHIRGKCALHAVPYRTVSLRAIQSCIFIWFDFLLFQKILSI